MDHHVLLSMTTMTEAERRQADERAARLARAACLALDAVRRRLRPRRDP